MTQQTLAMQAIPFPFFANGTRPTKDFRLDFNLFSSLRQSMHGRGHVMPVTIMGRGDFIHHVTLHLPEVASLIDESDFGILHLEMGAMKLATREAIVRYEFHVVRRHFSFIGYLFEHADEALYDAILVSYLEGLFLDETSPAFISARSLLTPSMENALRKAELRFEMFIA